MSSPMGEELPSGAVPISIGLGRRLAAQTTWAFHVAVVGYILLGWALPWPAAWWVYAVGAPFVQLGWIVFNDYCWLSIIEAKLRGEELVVVQPGGEEEGRVVHAGVGVDQVDQQQHQEGHAARVQHDADREVEARHALVADQLVEAEARVRAEQDHERGAQRARVDGAEDQVVLRVVDERVQLEHQQRHRHGPVAVPASRFCIDFRACSRAAEIRRGL